jgi:hypothetical protein
LGASTPSRPPELLLELLLELLFELERASPPVSEVTSPVIGDSKLPAALALPLAEPDPDALADPETDTLPVTEPSAPVNEEMAEVTGANGLPEPPLAPLRAPVNDEVTVVSTPVIGASGPPEPPLPPVRPPLSVPGRAVRMLVIGASGLPPSGLLPVPPTSRPPAEVTVLPSLVTTSPRFSPIGLPVALLSLLPALSSPWPIVDSRPFSGAPSPVAIADGLRRLREGRGDRRDGGADRGRELLDRTGRERLAKLGAKSGDGKLPTVETVLPSGVVSGLRAAVGPLPRLVTS